MDALISTGQLCGLITTARSGATAALLFAGHLLGKDDVARYEGWLSELGADPTTAKAPGGGLGGTM